MNKGAGYVGIVLALVSILWTAATQWQELKSRVTMLEKENLYLHGAITVPQETHR